MKSTAEMSFLEHLEEFRWRIIKSLIGVVAGAIVVFIFMDPLFALLLRPATSLESPPNLQVLKVHGMFLIKWGIAFVGGLILALPVVTFQLWKFVAPGLLENERRYAFPVIVFSFLAFAGGVVFAYFIIIPFSLEFFSSMGYVDVKNNFSINYYFSYILWLLVASGLVFELPVLVVILSSIGLVTPAFMRHYRRHSWVAIVVISALITPPDPVSLLMMGVPLVILYEISIFLSRIFAPKI